MATIASLFVNLKAGTAGFDRKMKRSRRGVSKFGSALGSLKNIALGVGAALAGAIAARALVGVVKGHMDAIDATAKLADRLGATTEALQGFRHAASIMGASGEELDKGFEMMTRRLGELAMGTGEAKYALDLLGLSHQKLRAMKPSEAFLTIADSVKKLTTQSERLAVSQMLFGRKGMKLVNMLQLGRSGIKELTNEADRFLLTFSRIDAAKVEEANDAMTRLKALLRGIGLTLTIKIAPVIEAVARGITSWATSGEGMAPKIEWLAKKIVNAAKWIADAFHGVKLKIFELGVGFHKMVAEVLGRLNTLNKRMGATPLGKSLGLDAMLITDEDVNESMMHYAKLVKWLAKEKAKPLPSVGIDEFFAGVEARARQTAAAIQADNERRRAAAAAAPDYMTGAPAMNAHVKMFQERRKRFLDAGKRAFEQTRTPLERFEKTLTNLDEMLKMGAIDWDTYGRSVRQAHKSLDGVKGAGERVGHGARVNTRLMNVAGLAMAGQRRDVSSKLSEQISELQKVNQNLDRLIDEGGLG